MERPIEEEDHDPTLFSPDSTREYNYQQEPRRYDESRSYQEQSFSEPRRTSRDRQQEREDYYFEGYAQASRSGGAYYRDKYYRDARYYD